MLDNLAKCHMPGHFEKKVTLKKKTKPPGVFSPQQWGGSDSKNGVQGGKNVFGKK